MGGKVLSEAEGIGLIFGRLTVTGWAGLTARRHRLWHCRCECGKEVEKELHDLSSGKVVSCGCWRRDRLVSATFKHGARSAAAPSELTRTFNIWLDIRRRCLDPRVDAYKDYGGRGITLDPCWEKFEGFLEDMGTCPDGYSIEREQVNGGYTKDNCHWMPRRMQNMNKRVTIRVRYQGQEWCFKRLCEFLQKPYLKTYKRYVLRGWDLARAFDMKDEDRHDLARIE